MIFNFYWSWYEDNYSHILESEDKTQEEFEEDCNRALKESFDKYISEVGDTWAGLPDWIEYSIKKLEEDGYKAIEPVKFGYFGLYLPKEEFTNDDEEIPRFSKQIEKMKKHNTKIEIELYDKDENDAH